jgi:hypothetical protein
MGRVQRNVASRGLEHAEHRRDRRRAVLEQERGGALVRRRRVGEQRPADTVRPGVKLTVVPLVHAVAKRERRRPPRRLRLEAGGDRLLHFAAFERGEGVVRPWASAAGGVRRVDGGIG